MGLTLKLIGEDYKSFFPKEYYEHEGGAILETFFFIPELIYKGMNKIKDYVSKKDN